MCDDDIYYWYSAIATDHNQTYSKITTESVRKECGRFPAADSTLKAKYEYFYSLLL
jgi:hypothetical protein